MGKVLDLDVLRPEPDIVKLNGHELDCGFIPTGLTFDINAIVTEAAKLDQDKIGIDDDVTKAMYDLSVRMCAVFWSRKYPEMDEEWFRENTDARTINIIGEKLRQALTRAYEGIDPKN